MKKILLLLSLFLSPIYLLAQQEDYADFYISVADTAVNYKSLKNKMIDLQTELNIKIDTMGRGYNAEKDLICLAEDDEDELYAGQYFPRRFPSESLSIEYLNFYTPTTTEKTLALITGIFESKDEAKKHLDKVLPTNNNAYLIKSNIYIGCMH